MEKKKEKGMTVFQKFAEFLAQDAGDRDAEYEVMVSDRSIVIVRCNFDDTKREL